MFHEVMIMQRKPFICVGAGANLLNIVVGACRVGRMLISNCQRYSGEPSTSQQQGQSMPSSQGYWKKMTVVTRKVLFYMDVPGLQSMDSQHGFSIFADSRVARAVQRRPRVVSASQQRARVDALDE